jgi:hypothetical protein
MGRIREDQGVRNLFLKQGAVTKMKKGKCFLSSYWEWFDWDPNPNNFLATISQQNEANSPN